MTVHSLFALICMNLTIIDLLQTQEVKAKEQVALWEAEGTTAKKNYELMMNLVMQNVGAIESQITLNVGGTLFLTTKETLMRVKDSYFTGMLESGHWKPQQDGTYFIDRDPDIFRIILKYMRYDELATDNLAPKTRKMLQADFDYFFPNNNMAVNNLGLLIDLQGWLAKPFDTTKVLWRGSTDGFTPKAFHERCDNRGPTLTVVESTEGWIFGGYNPIDWQSPKTGSWYKASGAFIFTLKDPHGSPPTQFVCTSQSKAITSNANCGPVFGGTDLVIFHEEASYTNFPESYLDTTGFGDATFTGMAYFEVKEIVVYAIQ